MSGKRLILTAGLALAAIMRFPLGLEAAPSLTWVQDTLYRADGTLFTGTAQISWRTFTASEGSSVPQNSLTVTIAGGVLRVRLVPTTNASAGAHYVVRYNADGKSQFTETWSVPPSGGPLRIHQVRVDSLPDTPPTAPAPLQIADIVGLAEALSDRALKGSGFAPGRAAVIDTSGELSGASGLLSDCVRVDGSSGACGESESGPVFVDKETPAGLIDGVNTVFILNALPMPEASLHLYRNGLLQREGVDYTMLGNTITFTGVSVPQTGDLISASYRR